MYFPQNATSIYLYKIGHRNSKIINMDTKTSTKTLLNRLSGFQQEDIEIIKSKQGHGYKYAPLDVILPIVNPLMHKHGIGIYQETNWDNELTKQYVQTTMYNVDDSKDCKISKTYIDDQVILPKMNKIQTEGALITYLRRYHVIIMLGLTTEGDTDAAGEKTKARTDYTTIFDSYLKLGKKTEAAMMASYNNYKSQMTNAEVTGIYTMIKKHFSEPKETQKTNKDDKK